MPLRLTYPKKTHKPADLKPHYEEFKRLNPELFLKWQSYALGSRIDDREFPEGVSTAAIEFLRERFEYDSELALISAFGDFGVLIFEEVHNISDGEN